MVSQGLGSLKKARQVIGQLLDYAGRIRFVEVELEKIRPIWDLLELNGNYHTKKYHLDHLDNR
jgi:hypothetical protein